MGGAKPRGKSMELALGCWNGFKTKQNKIAKLDVKFKKTNRRI
jgi:hypothetical protein